MIVRMAKVYIAVRSSDRDRLLDLLRELGVVHLVPVDPARAAADEQTRSRIEKIERALQELSGIAPVDVPPGLSGLEAAEEVLDIQRRLAEQQNRLATLHHLIEQVSIWGNVKRSAIDQLREAGVQVRFSVPGKQVAEMKADCVEIVAPCPARGVLSPWSFATLRPKCRRCGRTSASPRATPPRSRPRPQKLKPP